MKLKNIKQNVIIDIVYILKIIYLWIYQYTIYLFYKILNRSILLDKINNA